MHGPPRSPEAVLADGPGHLDHDFIAAAEWLSTWDLLVPEGYEPELDYSDVEALERMRAAGREEHRALVDLGLMSRITYARLHGLDTVADVPGTRALWLPAGLVPVSETSADQVAVEKLAPVGVAPQAAPARGGAAGTPGPPPITRGSSRQMGSAIAGALPRQGLTGVKSIAAAHGGRVSHRTVKALPAGGGRDPEDDPDAAALEESLTAALAALDARWQGIIAARVRSVQARQGTAYWSPAGTKAYPSDSVVDTERWEAEAVATAQPLTDPAGQGAAAGLIAGTVDPESLDPADDQTAALAAAAAAAALILAKGQADRLSMQRPGPVPSGSGPAERAARVPSEPGEPSYGPRTGCLTPSGDWEPGDDVEVCYACETEGTIMVRGPKKANGRHLDGVLHDDYPAR